MLAYFTIRLIFGIALMLCLMPRREVATPFFRTFMLLLLGMSVLGTLTTSGSHHWLIATAVVSFAGSTLWLLERRTGGTAAIFLVTALSLYEFRVQTKILAATAESTFLLVSSSGLASAGTLGAAMTGMLLGHRYLTAPGMPLAPLQRLNSFLGVAAVLRILVSAYALVVGAGLISTEVQITWLALRWLAGIVGPVVVSVMVWRILKYRNTQSATGVLFVGVILTFIGELAADLLFHDLKVPF